MDEVIVVRPEEITGPGGVHDWSPVFQEMWAQLLRRLERNPHQMTIWDCAGQYRLESGISLEAEGDTHARLLIHSTAEGWRQFLRPNRAGPVIELAHEGKSGNLRGIVLRGLPINGGTHSLQLRGRIEYMRHHRCKCAQALHSCIKTVGNSEGVLPRSTWFEHWHFLHTGNVADVSGGEWNLGRCWIGEDAGGFRGNNARVTYDNCRLYAAAMKRFDRESSDDQPRGPGYDQCHFDLEASKLILINLQGSVEGSNVGWTDDDDQFHLLRPGLIKAHSCPRIEIIGGDVALADGAPLIEVSGAQNRLFASLSGGTFTWVKRPGRGLGYGEVINPAGACRVSVSDQTELRRAIGETR